MSEMPEGRVRRRSDQAEASPGPPTVETRDFSKPQDESRPERSDEDESEDSPTNLDFLRPPQNGGELGRLGKFRILRELGRGGMGVVLLAEDLRLDRQVALKVMLPKHAARAKAKDRFLREAKTAASIENDHIITILQVDEDNGVPYLAMPVLKGVSLSDRLQREKRLPIPEVVRIGWEICDGLAAAHEHKLVHRDLKPGNLWIESPKGRVKILDFGLAKPIETDQHLTRTGAVVGTPAYMAPEQARNPHVDSRADLFSLGVILYQMLTGKVPFKGHDTISTLMSICNDPVEPPTNHVNDLPAAMNELVLKLLAKDKGERYQSAAEVGCALEAINLKHFAGRALATSDLKTTPSLKALVAKPVMPTPPPTPTPMDDEESPFAFHRKRDKLVSLSSSSEMALPIPAPKSSPPKRRTTPPATKPTTRLWPWLLLAGGMMAALAVVMVLVVMRIFGGQESSVAEVVVPKAKAVTVDRMGRGRPIELPNPEPEPVVAADDPFPQFDPAPLPPWPLSKAAPKPALAPFDAKQAKQHQEEWAAYLKTPAVLENWIGMKLVLVPPGEFDLLARGYQFDAKAPKHRIRLAHGYHLGATEVTIAQFKRFVDATGYKTDAETSTFGGGRGVFDDFGAKDWTTPDPRYNWRNPGPCPCSDDLPVVHVTWKDAQAFCGWLSHEDKAVYRLPTEAEWECACRAGNDNPRGIDGTEHEIWNHAWGLPQALVPLWSSVPPLHPVGRKLANSFGLHDMLGNAWELCGDDLFSDWIPKGSLPNVDPWGSPGVVCRGGAWDQGATVLHPSVRNKTNAPRTNAGFRVLRQIGSVDETLPAVQLVSMTSAVNPLGPTALVHRPKSLPGLKSWTIQPILGTDGNVRCQPNGPLFASRSAKDNAIRIWSNEGKLERLLLGHPEYIRSMEFSKDGKFLVSGDRTSVRLWNVESGSCVRVLSTSGDTVSLSPDAKSLLATGHHDDANFDRLYCALWNVEAGTKLSSTLVGDLISWSPKGDKILTASRLVKSPRICVVEATNPALGRDLDIPEENREPIARHWKAVAWSPDGTSLAAVDAAKRIHFWDAVSLKYRGWSQGEGFNLTWNESGSEVFQVADNFVWTIRPPPSKDKSSVRLAQGGWVAWRQLGKTIAIDSAAGIVVASAEDGKILFRGRELGRVLGNGKFGVVGDKTKSLAVCVDGGNLWRFDLDTGTLLEKRTWFDSGELLQAPKSGLVAIKKEGTPAVFDADLKRRKELPGARDGTAAMAWAPGGIYLAAASKTDGVLVWHASRGELERRLEEGIRAQHLAWSPDGTRLAVLDTQSKIRVYDSKSWKVVAFSNLYSEGSKKAHRIAWTPNGKNLFVTWNAAVDSLDVESGTCVSLGRQGYGGWISGVIGGPRVMNYLLAETDGRFWTFEASPKEKLFAGVFGNGLCMATDGRRFVAGLDKKGWLQAYDMKTHTKLGTLIPKMTGNSWICIGPDGHYVGSDGVEDHIVYVAITETGNQEIHTPAEFARRYGWKNDPTKARFAALPR